MRATLSLPALTRRFDRANELSANVRQVHSPSREEGWLRHQENFGEANLSAADGAVAAFLTLTRE